MCMSIFHCSRHFCTQPWWSNMWSGLLPPELLVFLTEPIDYSWQLFFFFFFAETTRVQNARILTHSQNEISIQWEPPLNSEHVDTYEVKYYSEHPTSNMTSVYTTFTNYTFKNLQSETRYYFEVCLWLCLWCHLGGWDVVFEIDQWFDSSSVVLLHIWDQILVITVPADGLAPNGARPSAGAVLTATLDMLASKYLWLMARLSDTTRCKIQDVS